ncbi:MAG: FAD-dependent oxidoreductase, partial [Planctomycetaceae bacterium]
INTDKIQTISGLIGQEEDFAPATLEKFIHRYTKQDDFLARNISRICEKYLGNKLFANIMMLGFAFQKGLIPVSMHSMAWAIKDTIRTDVRKNLYAFNMGRKLVVQSDLFQGPPQRTSWSDVLEEKCRSVIRRYGRRGQDIADQLREIVAGAIDAVPKLDDSHKRAVVVRAYDCLRWGGIEYARRYVEAVRQTYKRDLEKHKYAVTAAVIQNLANAMLIKDGPFIAELATSPEKYARDREKYNVNPANGDKIIYRHLLHPTFHVGTWAFRKDFALSGTAMKILRASRWLRVFKAWHRDEREFLHQYEHRLNAFVYASDKEYEHQLHVLSSPRCMNCMNPTCSTQGCPLENKVPQCVQFVYENRWREAADVLLESNNFPEFTSRICPAFCQQECKQSHNGYCVQFKDMEFQIIDRAFAEGWITPMPAARKTGRKVAIVGSGPAGLAAAQQLARAGHDVTVFEKDPAVGGLLRFGIPAQRLEKALIDRRIKQLEAEGVKFLTGMSVGRDVSASQLRNDFDAVLLATGATRSRDLNVPGRQLEGIHLAIDYLRQQTGATTDQPEISAKGKVVAVIGGGLTGEDCVETAILQGAREVHQFEILDKPPEKAAGQVEEDSD